MKGKSMADGRALLLDCDGVIVHSEPLNFRCWNDAFAEIMGITVDGNYTQIVGLDLERLYSHWCTKAGLRENELSADTKKRLLSKKSELFIERAPDQLERMPGIHKLIQTAKGRGIMVAVVSAALEKRLEFTLQSVGLLDTIDFIQPGETVLKKHNNFKDYRRAALELKAEPGRSLAVEDSISGVQAALFGNIGMVYGLTTSYSRAQLLQAGSHKVFNSLEKIIDFVESW